MGNDWMSHQSHRDSPVHTCHSVLPFCLHKCKVISPIFIQILLHLFNASILFLMNIWLCYAST